MNSKIYFSMSMLVFLMFIGFLSPEQDPKPWDIPEKYQNMENPLKPTSKVLMNGKILYNKHCKSCHGEEGLGDGPKAAKLDTPCGDFTTDEFKEQSDGALFYKTKEGRDDMPSFEKKIPYEEDIWSIVHYIRTLE